MLSFLRRKRLEVGTLVTIRGRHGYFQTNSGRLVRRPLAESAERLVSGEEVEIIHYHDHANERLPLRTKYHLDSEHRSLWKRFTDWFLGMFVRL